MNLYGRLLWSLGRAATKPRIAPLETSVTTWRVLPGDLDPFGHMTNSRYLAMMDLARIEHVIRAGLLRPALENRWMVPVGSACVDFKAPLRPFEAYEIHTRVLSWDERWFYLQQDFHRASGAAVGSGSVKVTFRGAAGTVPPDEVVRAALGSVPPRPRLAREAAARFGIEHREPIAIVGIGCRLPGGAHDPEALFRLLLDGRDGIVDIPADRWDPRMYHDPSGKSPGRAYVHKAGLLETDLHAFDAAFFGITPREAVSMDPQQRLLLETSWEAFEDAGVVPSSVAGSRTGVFVGGFMTDNLLVFSNPDNRELVSTHTATASTLTMLSNRLSYFYDVRGPSVSIDTACSSSLVALHYACQSLWSKESDRALVAGVNAITVPETHLTMAKGKFLSPTGRCHAFDAKADGYVRGEGAAVLLLEPLSVAEREGHRIYAVIRGTATNQDGRTAGISLPSAEAQMAVMREAYAGAGVDPRTVVYVEAHGTGTPAGDPIEARAIGTVVGASRGDSEACLLGSVKTNLGHLEAAAGVTGVLKTALCLQHGVVPHHPHLGEVNPEIPLGDLGLRIPRTPEPLPARDTPRVAGVNSFGYGGSNAHVVLEEAPARVSVAEVGERRRPHLLALSAKSKESLAELAGRYADRLERARNDAEVADICRSAALHREHLRHRWAQSAHSGAELVPALRAASFEEHGAAEAGGLLFVYTGMGPQWWGMGRELFAAEPAFRRAVKECDEAFRDVSGWSIWEEMARDEGTSRMHRTEVAQPANAVLQIALTRLWAEWGVVPDAVLGHSVGEVGAAYACGALGVREAMRVAYHRSRLQQRLAGRGGMLAVGLSEDAVVPWLGRAAIAAVNSEESVTLAGDELELARIARDLEAAGHFQRALRVDVPYHSPLMDEIEAPLSSALEALRPKEAAIPLYSTVTGARLEGEPLDGRYWWRNVRQAVRFASAFQQAVRAGHTTFVEVGPHPVLATSMRDVLQSSRAEGELAASLVRKAPELETMARALARVHGAGHAPSFRAYFGPGPYVPIPTYAWNRKVFWHEGDRTRRKRQVDVRHPLITHHEKAPVPTWTAELNLGATPYLLDHIVADTVVFPAAGYIEMVLAARAMHAGEPSCSIEQLEFPTAAPLREDEVPRLVLRFSTETASFSIHGEDESLRSRGKLFSPGRAAPALDVQTLAARLPEAVSASDLYASLARRGLRYGPAFRGVERVQRGTHELLAWLSLPEGLNEDGYHLHPVLLDAALHSVLALAPNEDGAHDIVPVAIDRVHVAGTPGRRLLAYGRLGAPRRGQLRADVTLAREDGSVVAEITGLACRMLPTASRERAHLASLYHARTWERVAPVSESGPRDPSLWIVLDDGVPELPQLELLTPSSGIRVLDLRACASLPPDGRDPVARGADRAGALVQTLRGIAHGRVVRYYVATRGAEAVLPSDGPPDVSLAPLLGLARTAMTERPDLHLTLVDLESVPSDPLALTAWLRTLGEEQELALRGGEAYAVRVRGCAPPLPPPPERILPAEGSGYAIALAQPGRIDSLGFVAHGRRAPGPGEVEIEVEVSALGFKDVMKALDLLSDRIKENTYFGDSMGMEGSGRIVRIGPGVTEFAPGDRVYGVAPHFLNSHVVLEENRVVKLPDSVGFEEGSSLMPLMTVHHGLVDIARIRPGERVLVHSATGGVGLSAIEVARFFGAEVIATAGTPEKRRYLRERGITHVSPSRDIGFADDVRAITGGRGVDVVLNFTPGEIMVKSLACLAPFGRFIELGKMSFDQDAALQLRPFNENLLYAAIDFDRIFEAKPDMVRVLARTVLEHIARGDFRPLPSTSFPASRVDDAFHTMARSKHIGRVCVQPKDPDLRVVPAPRSTRFSEGASYLVTGGLGGFGLEVARWLVGHGARHLALVGRRGEDTPGARLALTELRARGAEVRVFAADAGAQVQVQEVVDTVRRSMPPLRGVVHAAAVLEDCPLDALDRGSLDRVLSAKARGAWNLHLATEHAALDFFVLFSSVAALVGNAHQGNYVAANTFLDQLAIHRRKLGLVATSIQWGALAEAGMVARHDATAKHLESLGIRGLTTDDALAALGAMLDASPEPMAVADVDWTKLLAQMDGRAGARRFGALAAPAVAEGQANGRAGVFFASMGGLDEEAALSHMTSLVVGSVAGVMRLPAAELDPGVPLRDLGMDSTLALEIVTELEKSTGMKLPTLTVAGGPPASQIASALLARGRAVI
ncbi:SDR family NAD(P)-dependent oxidoreductase [Pendulispora rubella]|uniref:SDR family NAD(P)-dependent oxidoreductase n=1 Tax=Pendulispora rubella TaxID=2741070 RepID=A0ABZ2LHV2_9BACT